MGWFAGGVWVVPIEGEYLSIYPKGKFSSCKSFTEVISVCTMSIHLLQRVHENSDPANVLSEKEENSQE